MIYTRWTFVSIIVSFLAAVLLTGCPDNTPDRPNTPSELNATTLTETEVMLIWRDNSTNERGFDVFQSIDDNQHFVSILQTLEDTLMLRDRPRGKMLYYKVMAYNDGGNSDFSNIDSTSTLDAAPSSPTNLQARVEFGTDIILTWQDNSMLESGYRIFERLNFTGQFNVVYTTGSDIDSVLLSDRTQEEEYEYYVKGFNGNGVSEPSNTVPVQTGIRPLFLNLNWFNHPDSAYTGYNVPIGGSVVNSRGVLQRDIRVWFELNSDSMGVVTPWAYTNPDNDWGFEETPIFSGRVPGTAWVYGRVNDPNGDFLTGDTLMIRLTNE